MWRRRAAEDQIARGASNGAAEVLAGRACPSTLSGELHDNMDRVARGAKRAVTTKRGVVSVVDVLQPICPFRAIANIDTSQADTASSRGSGRTGVAGNRALPPGSGVATTTGEKPSVIRHWSTRGPYPGSGPSPTEGRADPSHKRVIEVSGLDKESQRLINRTSGSRARVRRGGAGPRAAGELSWVSVSSDHEADYQPDSRRSRARRARRTQPLEDEAGLPASPKDGASVRRARERSRCHRALGPEGGGSSLGSARNVSTPCLQVITV